MDRDRRIFITGAACAGVTTLGAGVADRLGLPHVDVDDVYWMPTDAPYTTKRPVEDRIDLLRSRSGERGWVLSGSFDGWGDTLIAEVHLIVFVSTPTPVRMERLAARETARHGRRILPGGDMHAIHVAFRDWASRYDVAGFSGRNRARHEAWLAEQTAPTLRLDGSDRPADLVAAVLANLGTDAAD